MYSLPYNYSVSNETADSLFLANLDKFLFKPKTVNI